MGEFSIYHWLTVLFIVLLLFGGRKIPELMRGVGEAVRSFRDGMNRTETPPTANGANAETKKT